MKFKVGEYYWWRREVAVKDSSLYLVKISYAFQGTIKFRFWGIIPARGELAYLPEKERLIKIKENDLSLLAKEVSPLIMIQIKKQLNG